MTAARKTTQHIECKQCSEFITLKRNDDIGKCLRDSMYKNLCSDKCEYGRQKK